MIFLEFKETEILLNCLMSLSSNIFSNKSIEKNNSLEVELLELRYQIFESTVNILNKIFSKLKINPPYFRKFNIFCFINTFKIYEDLLEFSHNTHKNNLEEEVESKFIEFHELILSIQLDKDFSLLFKNNKTLNFPTTNLKNALQYIKAHKICIDNNHSTNPT